MRLKLERPIVFFDLETTGTNITSDRIVEISMLKVWPDGTKETKTKRVNPGMPIPAEATAVHGITDEDVKDEPYFYQYAQGIVTFLENSDLGGYNCNRFDLPMLVEELHRANKKRTAEGKPIKFDFSDRKVIDVQVIFHKREPRTLTAAYEFYCDKNLDDAHSAEADTLATYEVLLGQLDKYGDLEGDIDFLDEYTTQRDTVDFAGRFIYDEEGKEVFNFGKYKGKRVDHVILTEPSYLQWMLDGQFPEDTKHCIRKMLAEAAKMPPPDEKDKA